MGNPCSPPSSSHSLNIDTPLAANFHTPDHLSTGSLSSKHPSKLTLSEILLQIIFPLLFLLLLSVYFVYYLASLLPSASHLTKDHSPINFNVHTLHDVQVLAQTLRHYSSQTFPLVLTLYISIYVLKQTFCIPGTAALNFIGGALYGPASTALSLTCTVAGIFLCYLLSLLFLPRVVHRLPRFPFPNTFWSLLATRLFPFTPQWLMNILAPHLHIPIPTFLTTSALGLLPYTWMTSHLGVLFTEIQTVDALFTPYHILQLLLLATVAAIPVVINRLKKKKVV